MPPLVQLGDTHIARVAAYLFASFDFEPGFRHISDSCMEFHLRFRGFFREKRFFIRTQGRRVRQIKAHATDKDQRLRGLLRGDCVG